MKEECFHLGILWRPGRIRAPCIGTHLKCGGLPPGLVTGAVEVVAKKRCFNPFAKFARGFMPPKRNDADRFAFWRLPLAMKPGPSDNKVRLIRIVLRSVSKYLPRSPGIFLVPKTCYVKVWDR